MTMETTIEYMRGLRYKLRQMGIEVKGPTDVFGDNKSVLVNASKPDSVLMKRSNSIAYYHHVCEGSTRVEWRVANISTEDNQADLMTKYIPYGTKRVKHCHNLLYWLYNNHLGT